MFNSMFFAQFWGILLIATSLAFLFRRENLKGMVQLIGDGKHTPIFGLIAFLLGLWTVLLHNLWVNDWRVVITIFGWLSLLKGISYLLWPSIIVSFAKIYRNNSVANFLLLICLALGAWLAYQGFMA